MTKIKIVLIPIEMMSATLGPAEILPLESIVSLSPLAFALTLPFVCSCSTCERTVSVT